MSTRSRPRLAPSPRPRRMRPPPHRLPVPFLHEHSGSYRRGCVGQWGGSWQVSRACCGRRRCVFRERSCIPALMGAQVFLTDLPDRLKLLKKNVVANVEEAEVTGSARVLGLEWGVDPDEELIEPLPDLILGSDVIYSEGAVKELLVTLEKLSGDHTTIFLAGELRNDVVLEYFLELAMEEFVVGRIDQTQWHPDYCSQRIVLFVLAKKSQALGSDSKGIEDDL